MLVHNFLAAKVLPEHLSFFYPPYLFVWTTTTCSKMDACSKSGNEGHVSELSMGSKGIMLFGVRVMEASSSFRKSASMNNLAQYEQAQDSNSDVLAAGYASDDVVHASGGSRERKRGNFCICLAIR